jgi:type IV fimbrial biogenesis protein FimT
MASNDTLQSIVAAPPTHGASAARGFTLIELMVALVILVVIAVLAAPAFSELIAGQRVQLAAMDLFTSLLRARGEAIKQNTDATITPTGAWSDGWAVQVGGTNIDSHAATPEITISSPGVITYRSSGRIAGTTLPKFSVSASQTSTQRCVKINLSGEPQVTQGACT